MLDKQINLFKVDTNAFLTEEEKEIGLYLNSLRKQKYENELILKKTKDENDKKEIEQILLELKESIKEENKIYKAKLLKLASDRVEYNDTHEEKIIRQLDDKYLFYTTKDGEKKTNLRNVVSMFESTLSRSFNIDINELTYDIFIVEIYYYDIAQDLIINGFDYNGKHYVYFSSSAGQIRTKKAVFVEEEKYNNCKNKLMCGLTIDKINEKGGMNVNKFLAYLALSNSATELWENVFNKKFDIDRCIVVNDFETDVKCKVDDINYKTYEIKPDVTEYMPIPHTDGCGMISSDYCNKNFMVRLPWIKGLLGSFDFKRFIKENNCSGKVIDAWGKEWDIEKDNIQIIFTKSQLKMKKYYDSWEQYKEYFKKYNCEAGVCNMEEDKIPNAKINYQMLQTLYNMTDKEIKDICKYPNKKIQETCDSLEHMLNFFGVYLDNENEVGKDYFQKSLRIYPELIKDQSNKDNLRDLKNSLVKKYKGGKLDVVGKFTFVLPDLYAFCEWLFMNIKEPVGLIADQEVFCRLYKNKKELDCLRSPSLYIEHAVRKNVCNKKYRNQRLEDWFKTDAVYISTHDLISRILQLDVDGDRLLVLAQKKIIDIAKRHMQGVNPLYYEMKKASEEIITGKSIYNGLRLAFTGGNIGVISNDITKIWNQDKITEEELKAVRWLCMETNFTIDYAKTLFKPERPKEVDEILKKFHRMGLPYFFYYAKDKELSQIDEINNSTLNRIVKEIKDIKLMFNVLKPMDNINYRLMLKDKKDEYFNEKINDTYNDFNKKYGENLNIDEDNTNKNNMSAVCNEVKKEFYKIEKDDNKILNSLVKHLYSKNTTRKKKLLWGLYGELIYNNLKENIGEDTEVCMKCGRRVEKEKLINNKCEKCRKEEIKKLGGKKKVKCIDCGKEFEVDARNNNIKRCEKCRELERKKHNKEMYEKRKNKNSTILN